MFEKKERCGLVSDLPIGYTYNPGIFDKEKQKSIDCYDYSENKLPKNTVTVPTRVDKTILPPGIKYIYIYILILLYTVVIIIVIVLIIFFFF